MLCASSFSWCLSGARAAGKAQPVRYMGICPLSFLVSLCSAPIFVRLSEQATPWTHFSSEWGNIQYLCRFRLAVDKVCCCSQAPEEIYCKLLVCSRNRWLLLLGSVANKDAVRRLIRIINCFHFFRPFSVISLALAESSVAWKTLCYLAAHFLEERVSQGDVSDLRGSQVSTTPCTTWDRSDHSQISTRPQPTAL